MTTPNSITLALQVMEELAPELQAAQTSPGPALPSVSQVLEELGPLPASALFLGMASDGLPVLLNLHSSCPGPLLVAGEAGAGKTAFLKVVARAAGLRGEAQDVQFAVVSNYPDEWGGFEKLSNCLGIFPTYQNRGTDFLLSLVGRAQRDRNRQGLVVLLLDDLESVVGADFEAGQNLRWLLLHGPERGIWPLATLNAGRADQMLPWLEIFRIRVLGYVRQEDQAELLSGTPGAGLSSLLAGFQFTLHQRQGWIRFWIPDLE